MGKTAGPYREEFPVGSQVKIQDEATLESFRKEWKLHNPLTKEQVAFAGSVSLVEKVGFYHGGDELYSLKGIPGLWHECCLQSKET